MLITLGRRSGRQRPGIEAQVGPNPMGTGKPTEGHSVEALAGETGITHAIEVFQARAVERHRQQTRELHRRDGAVAALKATQKTPVAAWRADLLVGDGIGEAGKDRLQALDQPGSIRLLFLAVLAGRQSLPGLHR